MPSKLMSIPLLAVAALGIGAAVVFRKPEIQTTENPTSVAAGGLRGASPSPAAPAVASEHRLVEPVADFKSRITKKFFGTHVTPQDSPVQPEKFNGYHTGVDAEYGDVTSDVPVHAVADGTVLLARSASGYGGVIAIQHTIQNQPVVGIYGHVDPARLPKVGQKVTAGEAIGFLGKALSSQTDGERRHLHFGLVKGTTATLTGYVARQEKLTAWLDPLTVF
jgi:murein DD-endopeptidase MepM/ murein hydrolase activator NlpD